MYPKAIKGLELTPELNLVRYVQSVRNFPILKADEEYTLAAAYVKDRNPETAYRLVTSHLRLVIKVVSNYKGYGLPVGEMIAEGNIGLLYAVEKFDPSKGFRFSTYALWWIKAAIQKYILSSWSLVKIGTTAAQKKLFFNLRKIKSRLNLMDDREMTNDVMENIASCLNVKEKEVYEMNARLKSHDGSLNVLVDSDSGSGLEWIDFVADNKPNQEDIVANSETMVLRRQLFNRAMCKLNEREKDILVKRRLLDKAMTLDDLSHIYNISKERVRQIELNSIKKLQKEVMKMAA
jgi:RNA polymerase sigma-32 factor